MTENPPVCIAKLDMSYETNAPQPRSADAIQAKWPDGVVTYSLTNDTDDIEGTRPESIALNRACTVWGVRTARLKFKRIFDGVADIMVRFTKSDPYFTSPSILAYTWYPNPASPLGGDMTFNDDPKINWSLDGLPIPAYKIDPVHYKPTDPQMANTINLQHVMIHELGHALGLSHIIDCPQCIMYPYYHNDLNLNDRDVSAVQLLYGKRQLQQSILDSIKRLFGKRIV